MKIYLHIHDCIHQLINKNFDFGNKVKICYKTINPRLKPAKILLIISYNFRSIENEIKNCLTIYEIKKIMYLYYTYITILCKGVVNE